MIPRLKSSVPVFELAIIASLIAIAWVLAQAYGRLDEARRQRLEPPPRPEARQVAQVIALAQLGERYTALANRLQGGLQRMRGALDAFVRDRTVSVSRYVEEADTLQRQLAESLAQMETPAFLQTRAELLAGPGLKAEPALSADLQAGGFLTNVIRAVSNHVAALSITAEQPLTPDIVQRKIGRATDTENAVLALVAEARQRRERLEGVLERRGIEWVAPAAAPERAEGRAEPERTWELILRLLAGVFLVLAAVLVLASYRRLVVLPLHQRIIENATSTEYQRKLDHFSRLATGLAHEIRNPLTAINIRLFTLQKSLSAGSSKHADTVLIRNEIDRLEQILKDFLRLARPSEPRLAQLTAQPLLDETHSLLSEQCRLQGVDLRVERAADAPFLGDSVQLKQVLINLVKNASESIGGHGQVTLRAYEKEVETGPAPARNMVLEVEDTGAGIAPDVQERLFDPFFSTKDSGTGLGLPIAAKIVDQHKGRLEFETHAERGTTFRVILPIEGPRQKDA